jgi:protein-tyrosine kinase
MDHTPAPGALDREIARIIKENSAELTSLSGNLLNAARGQDVRTLLVTSSHPGEGKTVSAVSIASTLAAHVHSQVALLDANFYAPRLHELFRIRSAPGLSDVLVDGLSCRKVLHETDQQNLRVVPAGTPLAGYIGNHEAVALKQVLAELRTDFDHVVVDGCHFFDSSTVAVLANLFDGVVFVIECEKTNWEVVQQVTESLKTVGGKVLGAVLNRRRYYIPGKLYGKI